MTSHIELVANSKSWQIFAERLRNIARAECGIRADAEQELVDLWLYRCLCHAVFFNGPLLPNCADEEIIRAIESSLRIKEGPFVSRCASSFSELVANLCVGHEVSPDVSFPLSIETMTDLGRGAVHEYAYDVFGLDLIARYRLG